MTAQDLKNSILQLAVQGKLVPQNPNDEPASVLLKRIRAEKERLVKEGKIKKDKVLAPIVDDETPFDIPESWEWIRLGDFCSVYNGDSINADEKQAKYSKKCDGHCYIGTKDVGFDNSVNYDNGVYIPLSESSFKIAYADSVLMCMEGGSAGRKIAIIDKDVCFGNKLCCFSPVVISNKYLFFFLQSKAFFTQFTALMTGIIGGVGAQKLKSITMPVPPLAEQERIVAKIEELLPYIEEYDKAEKQLSALNAEFPDKLRKSILQQAVMGKLTERDPADEPASELLKRIHTEKEKLIKEGKIKKEKPLPPISADEIPFEIPETWEWTSIGDTCVNIQYGTSEKSSSIGKVAVLRMGNLQNGRIDYSNLVYSSNDYDIERCHLDYNDLLFNRTNSKELVGKTAIYKAELPAIYAGYLIRITPVMLDSDYLNYVMQSAYYKSYCLEVKTDAISQSNINAEKLKKFVFPLPPLAEQRRIVARVEELLKICDELK